MQDAASFLGDRLKTVAGRVVSIVQGALRQDNVTAVLVFRDYQIFDEEGIMTSVHAGDWTIVASDLLVAFEFRAGDLIVDADATYEVLPIGDRPCVEPQDSAGVLLLVHSKEA
jgi:hypothetical protein